MEKGESETALNRMLEIFKQTTQTQQEIIKNLTEENKELKARVAELEKDLKEIGAVMSEMEEMTEQHEQQSFIVENNHQNK